MKSILPKTRTLTSILSFFSAVCLLIFTQSQAQVNLNNGLVAYYPFNGNALDSSGHNNNPSFNNATLTTDRFGNANSAYSFNGSSSYMQIPASPTLDTGSALTVSYWVKPNAFYMGQCTENYVLSKGLESGNDYELSFGNQAYGAANGINFCSTATDTSHEGFYGIGVDGLLPTIHTGQWYHVLFTNNGKVSNMYVNGTLVASNAATVTFNNNDIYLGRYTSIASTPYWLNGVLDDIRIYNRALSSNEVTALYTAPNPAKPLTLKDGLVAYYPFSGNALDSSGNNNNPSFNNATLTTDRFGNANSAYSFNGSSSYVQIPNSTSLNTGSALTVSYWVKPNAFYTDACTENYVLSKGLESGNNYEFAFGNQAYFTANGINNCSTPTDTTHEAFYGIGIDGLLPTIHTGQWYHVVFTNNGKVSNMYVNGTLVVSGTAKVTFNNNDIYLGRYTSIASTPYWLNGVLDDIRIYNRALDSSDVKALYTPANPACSNYLNIPAQNDGVQIGNLSITGNQITVEAEFNRTSPYSGSYVYAGNIVSKHGDPTDVNYILRPSDGEVTTTAGYFITPDICTVELNKTYHVAMVYDGTKLKFYRNGFLMSSVAATGNLITNNWPTKIGSLAKLAVSTFNESLLGYINEVRIWNVARTQQQIRAYMNTSLPNPKSQSGLKAYYIFNSLKNLQGDSTLDGTLLGGAKINQANPTCNTFTTDSCHLNPLPITLQSFTAYVISSPYTNIQIATQNEVNAGSITIERSLNGTNFTEAALLAAKGNKGINNYNYTDKVDATATKVYYRLKLMNKDGSYQYSNVVSVVLGIAKTLTVELFPNPIRSNALNVNMYLLRDEVLTIRVLDINGKVVAHQTVQGYKGQTAVSIPAFKTLLAGIYTVNVTSNGEIVNKKVIKVD